MEESGSIGLDELLIKKKKSFLNNVDYVCISDSYWLGTEKPCLTYGLRGMCCFGIEIEGSKKDLHSGMYGGTVLVYKFIILNFYFMITVVFIIFFMFRYESMSDLIYVLDQLVDKKGNILIPKINDDVELLNEKEKELYDNIQFDVDTYIGEIGVSKPLQETKVRFFI